MRLVVVVVVVVLVASAVLDIDDVVDFVVVVVVVAVVAVVAVVVVVVLIVVVVDDQHVVKHKRASEELTDPRINKKVENALPKMAAVLRSEKRRSANTRPTRAVRRSIKVKLGTMTSS